jgi:trehalose 6-phosphate synthase
MARRTCLGGKVMWCANCSGFVARERTAPLYHRPTPASMQLPFVKRVIKSLDGRALIIGVDRLDYSKGIAERLSAFERFLERQAEWRGKVTYLQIAPKSRTEIPEYADIEQEIGAAAGRINGAYGEADWTPIRYVNRAYGHATLAGLYRAARVALITPLLHQMMGWAPTL